MSEQQSPEEILEQQKKNCIFCKIVAGEVESKKVYEDEHYLAIMDIRPAAEGHVVLLPKEHAPILQLLPQERLLGIFAAATRIGHAVRKATIAESVTIFAANGYAAGQQAPHAMLHIIPREKGDGLSALDLEDLTVDQADAVALKDTFAQATVQALSHLGRKDLLGMPAASPSQRTPPEQPSQPTSVGPGPETLAENDHETASVEGVSPEEEVEASNAGPTVVQEEELDSGSEFESVVGQQNSGQQEVSFEDTNEALQMVLETNSELRNLLIAQPSFVEDYVAKSPKLKKLFEGVDIHALSRVLRLQDEKRKANSGTEVRKAAEFSDEELFAFIDGNEGLRTWLLENPEELANNIGQNPRLAAFFDGVDIGDLAMKYRAYRKGGAE